MRGGYRNSIKVNEPGAQPPFSNVMTSYFLLLLFFFFSFLEPGSVRPSTTGSDPVFIKGWQGQTEHMHAHTCTQKKTDFNYWGEEMASDHVHVHTV